MTAAILDFNDSKPQGYFSSRQLDQRDYVRELKDRMAVSYRSVLQHLWPAGKFVGSEFEVGDIHGAPGRSFKISCRRDRLGVGCDFAGNVVTSDLIDVWAHATLGRSARGRDFAAVTEEIEDFLGRPFKPQPKATEAVASESFPPPSAQWNYTDINGNIIVTVYRYDWPELDKDGKRKKAFRPWTVALGKYAAPESDRPLYNLPGIAPAPFVVFAEGEKAAEALIKAGIPTTCAMSGSKAPIEKTDWQPLAGKHVIIWPDADETGRKFAEAVAARLRGLATSVGVVKVPAGKPEGWDVADALAEGVDVRPLLNEATGHAEARPRGRVLEIEAWGTAAYAGEPKAMTWLVDGVMPLERTGLLVAMGDAGKGILTLDLALKIATPKHPDGLVDDMPRAFGGTVSGTGAVVVLSAEDDRDEVHRRLDRLDPDGQRFAPGVRLYVVPLPDAGGPLPLVKTSSVDGPFLTPEWAMLLERLAAIPDLRLVVIDPLVSFVHADVNADPAAGAFVMGNLAHLAKTTGATVLVCHHMGKTAKPITTPEEARAAIRGTTALVDEGRFAYALWHADEADGKRVCAALGRDWERGRVLKGAVVKSNAPADRTVRTYVRNAESGLLVDKTERLRGDQGLRKATEMDTICLAIVTAASAGFPYTYSGSAGLYERRGELPEMFHDVGKHRIRGLADELMTKGRLARVRGSGQSQQWLDAPDGDFAKGLVSLAPGAYQGGDENNG